MKIQLLLNIDGQEIYRNYELEDIEEKGWQAEVVSMADSMKAQEIKNDRIQDEYDDVRDEYPSDHYNQDPVKQDA